ncbi:MAG: hypothetical protein HY326_13650 [Chloroflexi bacterium]|nr:hypothetical protein [Chloroflexota bacterium]
MLTSRQLYGIGVILPLQFERIIMIRESYRMDKEKLLEMARFWGVPMQEEDAAASAPGFARIKQMLERMKKLPLEGLEPPVWFVMNRRR